MWSDLTLDPSFKVKRVQPILKMLTTLLLLVLEVCNVKPTYRKSWAGNVLMKSAYNSLIIRVIRVGNFAASKISSAHMRSNNQYLLETLPQK